MTAQNRVRELMRMARELVRQEYPDGGEEVFLAVFRQLCLEREIDASTADHTPHDVVLH